MSGKSDLFSFSRDGVENGAILGDVIAESGDEVALENRLLLLQLLRLPRPLR